MWLITPQRGHALKKVTSPYLDTFLKLQYINATFVLRDQFSPSTAVWEKKSFYYDTDLRHHTQRMKVFIYMEVFLFYCVSILYTGFIVHLVYLL